MNYLLSEAEEPIREALNRLVAKNEKRKPYIIVQKVVDRRIFVQFATYREKLLFDVPLTGVYLEEVTVEQGAKRAVETLESLDVRPNQRVLIIEDEQKSKGELVPWWQRLFT